MLFTAEQAELAQQRMQGWREKMSKVDLVKIAELLRMLLLPLLLMNDDEYYCVKNIPKGYYFDSTDELYKKWIEKLFPISSNTKISIIDDKVEESVNISNDDVKGKIYSKKDTSETNRVYYEGNIVFNTHKLISFINILHYNLSSNIIICSLI